ncbi:hypothetical protein MTO96_038099, partial [Rhipicephalus appendiculatus]
AVNLTSRGQAACYAPIQMCIDSYKVKRVTRTDVITRANITRSDITPQPKDTRKDITQSKVPRSDVVTRAKVTRSGVITRAKVTGRDDVTRAKVTRSDVFTRIVANCEVTSSKDCPIHRRRELEDEPSFEETKSDVLFACFVPIVLTILGIGLVFILSPHGKAFLICRMRSKDLWEEVVKPATRFCTHLILTPWGNDFDERDRSEQEFFRAAFNRTRLYLTVPPEDCTRTNINELMTRLRSLRLDGFEFYMKGNESANDVRLCSNLIDRFVSLKDPSAAILRSGPYGTLVKPNVLANVYHVHAPIDDDGRIHDAIFINNYDYTDTGHGGVDMVRIADVLMRAQKERAESVAAGGAPHHQHLLQPQLYGDADGYADDGEVLAGVRDGSMLFGGQVAATQRPQSLPRRHGDEPVPVQRLLRRRRTLSPRRPRRSPC